MGRVKARNPLGHSGHRRLQAVVGSMLTLIGSPLMRGSLVRFACWKLLHTRHALRARAVVRARPQSRASRSSASIGEKTVQGTGGCLRVLNGGLRMVLYPFFALVRPTN